MIGPSALALASFLAAAAFPGRAAEPRNPEEAPPAPIEEPGPQEEDDFDPAQYPAHSLVEVLASSPCARGRGFELKDIMFSSELVYGGDLRDTPSGRRELVRRWTASLKAEDQAGQFSMELRLANDESPWWMPVPESLVEALRQELVPGSRAVFYMSYVGCEAGEPMVAIEEFSTPQYEDLDEESDTYIT